MKKIAVMTCLLMLFVTITASGNSVSNRVERPYTTAGNELQINEPETDNTAENIGSLYPVKKGWLYGYINERGEMVIEPEFSVANRFYEGYAAVEKDGLYGYIDKSGNLTIPCQFDEAKRFSEGKAAVKKDGKWGYINTAGEVVIPYKFYDCKAFSQGRALIAKETGLVWPKKYYGFIDETGSEVIPCIYTQAESFSDGLAWVTGKEESNAHFIDLNGNKVFSVQYRSNGFSEGLAAEYNSRTGRYHFINTDGAKAFSGTYNYVYPYFSDGLTVVSDNAMYLMQGEYYYIDTAGRKAFDGKTFAVAYPFSDGYALVQQQFGAAGYTGFSTMQQLPYAFIDRNGQQASREFVYAESFEDGFAIVREYKKIGNIVTSDSKRKLINRNFEVIWEFED